MEKDVKLLSGLFIPLYDADSLLLYLKYNTYGFLMSPQNSKVKSRSRHFHALADYACTREGTHVFFFFKRKIYYGGTIIGNKNKASFYLNGRNSPLGILHKSEIFWDESKRYIPTKKEGVFKIEDIKNEKSQPFIIRFSDTEIKGKAIKSDELYYELGKLRHPLPSNSITGMGFCTLTPIETKIALKLLQNSNENILDTETSKESLSVGKGNLFNGDFGFDSIYDAHAKNIIVNEAHLEAALCANPSYIPDELRPSDEDVICRQVPISPFKPRDMDRADICIYKEDSILEGALPNEIIELKNRRANSKVIEQVERYLKWMELLLKHEQEQFNRIKVNVLAPSYTSNVKKSISEKYKDKISLYDFNGNLI